MNTLVPKLGLQLHEPGGDSTHAVAFFNEGLQAFDANSIFYGFGSPITTYSLDDTVGWTDPGYDPDDRGEDYIMPAPSGTEFNTRWSAPPSFIPWAKLYGEKKYKKAVTGATYFDLWSKTIWTQANHIHDPSHEIWVPETLRGTIRMFSGITSSAITLLREQGYVFADGSIINTPEGYFQLPDLRGKMLIATRETATLGSPLNPDFWLLEKTLGVAEITLATNQLPVIQKVTDPVSHTHNTGDITGHQTFRYTDGFYRTSGGVIHRMRITEYSVALSSASGSHTHTIPAVGLGQAHDNIPPHFVTAFMVKL